MSTMTAPDGTVIIKPRSSYSDQAHTALMAGCQPGRAGPGTGHATLHRPQVAPRPVLI